MSTIRAIYAHLAQQPIAVDGVTPAAFDLAQLPSYVDSAMLPCRLLTPMNPRSEAREFGFTALGKLAKVTWHLTDLLLWREAATGIGLEDIAPLLIDYVAAYMAMLRQHRSMGQTQAHLISARFTYGTFEWPDQSTHIFDGVSCELDIEEVLSGA